MSAGGDLRIAKFGTFLIVDEEPDRIP